MRRPVVFILVVVLAAAAGGGCDFLVKKQRQMKAKKNDEGPLVQVMDDVNLAKLLVRPKVEPLTMERDPFKPLVTKERPAEGGGDDLWSERLRQLTFLGVVKFDQSYSALIMTGDAKGVYQVDQNVKGFTIRKIEPERIILGVDGENKTFILNRGEK